MPATERPKNVTAALALVLGTGVTTLVLALYAAVRDGKFFPGVLLLLLAAIFLFAARSLHRNEASGWGAAFLASLLSFLFGLAYLPLAGLVMALSIAVLVLLFLVREYFGMVRYDPEEEERKKKELRAERTKNPAGLACRKCGSKDLWIAPDGSAFCEQCKTGIISTVPAS